MTMTASRKADLPNINELWDFQKPEDTEIKFRDLLPTIRNEDVSYRIQLLTQIARAQGLQRKFDEAHQTLDEAQSLLTDDLALARVRILLERGRVYNSSKDPARARPLFLEALEAARAAGEDFYAIDAAHMMGIIEPPQQQLEWNLLALDLAEQSSDSQAKKWLGSLYNNIGWTYHSLGDYDQALDIFQKALKWREEDGPEPEIRIAKWSVARALRSLHRVPEALKLQRELLGEYARVGEQSGYVYEELAECLLLLGEADEARQYFSLAYRELSRDPWLTENEPARIERLNEMGSLSGQERR